jgi:hypothetical protein
MSLVVPDVGEELLLRYIVGETAPGDPRLKLFTNDLTPDEDTVIGDITEAVDGGYSAITLDAGGGPWAFATSGTGVTSATYPQQTFNFVGGADIFGYFITDSLGALMWLERFATAPKTIPGGGGPIKIDISVSLD